MVMAIKGGGRQQGTQERRDTQRREKDHSHPTLPSGPSKIIMKNEKHATAPRQRASPHVPVVRSSSLALEQAKTKNGRVPFNNGNNVGQAVPSTRHRKVHSKGHPKSHPFERIINEESKARSELDVHVELRLKAEQRNPAPGLRSF